MNQLQERQRMKQDIMCRIDALERKAYQMGVAKGRRECSEPSEDKKQDIKSKYMAEGANALKQALTDI